MPHLKLRASFTIGEQSFTIYEGPIHVSWQAIAEGKGFEITARVRDRFHLELRCDRCGETMITKLFTLRTAVPSCQSCRENRLRKLCRRAGVTYLGRDDRPHYLRIRLACGHETSRQQELLERVGRGKTGIRCGHCLGQRLKREAGARGWELIGDDPDGQQGYRLYRHECGHIQRVALANMTTGRFTCGGCSDGWTRDKSYIYAMRFVLKSGREVIKVGFSRDPESRLRHQLTTERDQSATLIRKIEFPTGREALRLEKKLHLTLRRLYPEAVLDREVFAREIKVVTELYDARIEDVIMRLLDDLAAGSAALAKRKAKRAKRAGKNARRRRRQARR